MPGKDAQNQRVVVVPAVAEELVEILATQTKRHVTQQNTDGPLGRKEKHRQVQLVQMIKHLWQSLRAQLDDVSVVSFESWETWL